MLTASAAIAALSLMLPLALLQVYDRIIPNSARDTALILGLAVGSAILLECLLRVARSSMLANAGESFERATGGFLFSRILGADARALGRVGTGEHVDRFNSISAIRDFEAGQPMVLVFDAIFGLVFLAFVALIGGAVAFWPLATIVVVIIVALLTTPELKRRMDHQIDCEARTHDFLMSAVSSTHTIRALGMETPIVDRHQSLQHERAVANLGTEGLTSHLGDFTGLMINCCTVGVVCHGALLVNASSLTTGALAACTILSGRALQPLRTALGMWNRYVSVHTARKRMHALGDVAQSNSVMLDDAPSNTSGDIRLVGVSYASPDDNRVILPPTSLHVSSGEIICLIGPNSSGKSTVLQLVSGDIAPSTGSVLVDGQNVGGLAGPDRRKRIAVLSDTDTLFRGSIMDNITGFRPELREQAIAAARFLDFAGEIDLLPQGFDTQVTEVANTFSRGLVQRVCLARAMMDRPSVICADQAFSALDHKGIARVLQLIETLRGQVTLVLVTYDPRILAVADRVFDLWEGELRTEGDPDMLRKSA